MNMIQEIDDWQIALDVFRILGYGVGDRIPMFLGLPDPALDPLIRGMDLDPDPDPAPDPSLFL